MHSNLVWLIGLSPLALALAAAATPFLQADGRRAATVALTSSLLSLVVSVAAAIATAFYGVLTTGTLGLGGAGVALYLDALSAAILVLVSFVGLIVVAYSRNYLDGSPRQASFIGGLCATLTSVLLFVASGNLLLTALAWIGTSLALNKLLLFHAERPAAIFAARKKFIVSRLGDLCLLTAMVVVYLQLGTLDYASVLAGLRSDLTPERLGVAGLLLVGAAILKSAQFPLHGWLTEVMETPTPVSALLHAGVINAGGFLVLRFADLITLSDVAMTLLVVVGAVTALFGSLVMLTQTSVKVSLAYSTIAQMGFMLLQCGLGAFSAAALHIIAHSLYKAHAFLSSGSVMDLARASWSPSPGGRPHPARLALGLVAVLAIGLGVGALFGATLLDKPGVVVLGAVLLLGLGHLVAQSIDERPSGFVIARTLGLCFTAAAAYFALQSGAEWLLEGALPANAPLRGAFDLALAIAVILAFTAVTLFQGGLPGASSDPRWRALYVHLAGGLYINTIANRLIVRLWPVPPRRPANPLAAEVAR